MTTGTITEFRQMALSPSLLRALDEVGYEKPSPIQARTIPLLLEGRDVLGQAQTGTGKTAAFALPLLSNLTDDRSGPQVLVLAPTRELAIQVSEAFQKYASHMDGFHVLPIYGGQDFRTQFKALKRGVQVVVGTPGRVMDHMRRGTLKLDALRALVLDEADEMLRMGFIDDVEWILEHTPDERQIALFSATMPSQVRQIANRHLKNPAHVTIEVKTATADTIRQRYWPVSGMHKLDALTRILEGEDFDALIIFVRTKLTTADLASKLEARGYAAEPLSGDVAQAQRERTVERLKNGKIDIIVATDVAARGLDVERISHVINYDIPYDTEAYVHRIGRTGRAGRHGDAILFVAPRETRMLRAIEKATRSKIEKMDLPSTEWINDQRVNRFKQRINEVLASEDLELFTEIVAQYQRENDVEPLQLAAALAYLAQGSSPLFLKKAPPPKSDKPARDKRPSATPDEGMERYRVEVGRNHQIKVGNLVGAIANEAGLDSQHIGRITLYDDFSLVDLPQGMPKEIFQHLRKVYVGGKPLNIAPDDGTAPPPPRRAKPPKSAKGKAGAGKKKSKDSKRKQKAG